MSEELIINTTYSAAVKGIDRNGDVSLFWLHYDTVSDSWSWQAKTSEHSIYEGFVEAALAMCNASYSDYEIQAVDTDSLRTYRIDRTSDGVMLP